MKDFESFQNSTFFLFFLFLFFVAKHLLTCVPIEMKFLADMHESYSFRLESSSRS